MKIQNANVNDLLQIVKLKKEWYKEWRYKPKKAFYQEYFRVLKGLLKSEKRNIIVAKEGNNLIGYGLGCSKLYNNNGICLDVVTDTSYIFEIYVKKEYRKKGIAFQILKLMKRHFKLVNKKHIFGITYPWNKAAINLLKKDRWKLSGNTYTKKL